MKIRQTYFFLIFIITISIVTLKDAKIQINKRVTTETTAKTTTTNNAQTTTHATTQATTQAATQATTQATTQASTQTTTQGPKKGSGGKHTNSIGLKVNKNVLLNKWPFMISRCDQLVLFKAKYISDMGDYRFRKDGFFTISAYYVNQFRDKDAKKLDQSVLLTESTRRASHLRGARGCVVVNGGRHRQDIAMCLANKKQANNILQVLREFEKCRMGDDLQPISAAMIRKLIKACGKNGKFVNPFKLAKKINKKQNKKGGKKKKLRKFSNNPWYNDRKNHYHPAKLKVPGSR